MARIAAAGRRGRGEPSAWVLRFAPLVRANGHVLDVACGAGRHSEWFLESGRSVVALDRDVTQLDDLVRAGFERRQIDLEVPDSWPFHGYRFDAVVVTNYLWRPLLTALVDAVAADGVLIYETFALGNERHGRPSNPEFLLNPGELLETVARRLVVVAYESGLAAGPPPRVVQRLCAVGPGRELAGCRLDRIG